ncbi:SRPBCC family protein [Devosia sp. ZB163]|uniref:SRPBCC family protein n=1 Tax=Devosia sp. ZB163 TaxID=3025938 RepID=UPI00235F41CD|nr:SRPBCC family protein [Devosia sp. ZB163]MDC9825915.1 SRPBCC family protein [Devosia sp. ZB163]
MITRNPELDLSLTRTIKAPRDLVWSAWTTPASFEQWWIPRPALCRIAQMDVVPGGALVTRISENGGDFVTHFDGCYLAVDDGRRLVFTNSLVSGWRPAEQPFMTAIITLADHAEGTEYTAYVMHKSPDDRNLHEEMGFFDGWGTVADQLAEFVERGVQ